MKYSDLMKEDLDNLEIEDTLEESLDSASTDRFLQRNNLTEGELLNKYNKFKADTREIKDMTKSFGKDIGKSLLDKGRDYLDKEYAARKDRLASGGLVGDARKAMEYKRQGDEENYKKQMNTIKDKSNIFKDGEKNISEYELERNKAIRNQDRKEIAKDLGKKGLNAAVNTLDKVDKGLGAISKVRDIFGARGSMAMGKPKRKLTKDVVKELKNAHQDIDFDELEKSMSKEDVDESLLNEEYDVDGNKIYFTLVYEDGKGEHISKDYNYWAEVRTAIITEVAHGKMKPSTVQVQATDVNTGEVYAVMENGKWDNPKYQDAYSNRLKKESLGEGMYYIKKDGKYLSNKSNALKVDYTDDKSSAWKSRISSNAQELANRLGAEVIKEGLKESAGETYFVEFNIDNYWNGKPDGYHWDGRIKVDNTTEWDARRVAQKFVGKFQAGHLFDENRELLDKPLEKGQCIKIRNINRVYKPFYLDNSPLKSKIGESKLSEASNDNSFEVVNESDLGIILPDCYVLTNNGFYDLSQKGLKGVGTWVGFEVQGSRKDLTLREHLIDVARLYVVPALAKYANTETKNVKLDNFINSSDMIRVYVVNNSIEESSSKSSKNQAKLLESPLVGNVKDYSDEELETVWTKPDLKDDTDFEESLNEGLYQVEFDGMVDVEANDESDAARIIERGRFNGSDVYSIDVANVEERDVDEPLNEAYVIGITDYVDDELTCVGGDKDGYTYNGQIDPRHAKRFATKEEAQAWIDSMNAAYDKDPDLTRFNYKIMPAHKFKVKLVK